MKHTPSSLVLLAIAGCGPELVMATGDPTGTATDAASTSTIAETTGTDAASSTTDTGSVDETGPAPTNFIDDPDLGPADDCDIFAQDCPQGFKCVPWGSDGGSSWNATGCRPVVEDPAAPGEPCMVLETGTSGLDTCALGAICWDVDPETNEGTCVSLCTGSEDDLHCDDPGERCNLSGDGALILCLPICDPIAQDCLPGQACYPMYPGFACGPDASGDMGAVGDPCEYINVCDPGLACVDSNDVPGCVDAIGCCSPICVVGDDSPCLPGQVCERWSDAEIGDWEWDPLWEDVGICALPA